MSPFHPRIFEHNEGPPAKICVMAEVTRILSAIDAGDEAAPGRLMELVYGELHSLATAKLSRERSDHGLQPTALIHETWLRLSGNDQSWENRRHFFGAAAEAMRRILVEMARRKARLKHGGAHRRTSFEDLDVAAEEADQDILALDEALECLGQEDPQKAALVKLRHFGGLTQVEAAEVLGISKATADRWWAYARAFLLSEIRKGDPD